MAVAKTYASYPLNGEPFEENKRMYVNVVTSKGLKKVRWYTDAEYKRMYPDAIIEDTTMNFNARHVFGFGDKGYILIYKGQNIEEWAENDRTNIWFNLTFGYYTPSKLEPPKVLNGIEAIQLKWEDVMAHDDRMKPHEEVQKIVAALLHNESTSTYQGTVNEWLQKEVTIINKKSNETHFGTKHIYTMIDTNKNIYVWETGAKDYANNTSVTLKMKVKEHKEIDGAKATVVWYCKEC